MRLLLSSRFARGSGPSGTRAFHQDAQGRADRRRAHDSLSCGGCGQFGALPERSTRDLHRDERNAGTASHAAVNLVARNPVHWRIHCGEPLDLAFCPGREGASHTGQGCPGDAHHANCNRRVFQRAVERADSRDALRAKPGPTALTRPVL